MVQHELKEAREVAGANRGAGAAIARQIKMLIEDQSQRRQDIDAQSRLRTNHE